MQNLALGHMLGQAADYRSQVAYHDAIWPAYVKFVGAGRKGTVTEALDALSDFWVAEQSASARFGVPTPGAMEAVSRDVPTTSRDVRDVIKTLAKGIAEVRPRFVKKALSPVPPARPVKPAGLPAVPPRPMPIERPGFLVRPTRPTFPPATTMGRPIRSLDRRLRWVERRIELMWPVIQHVIKESPELTAAMRKRAPIRRRQPGRMLTPEAIEQIKRRRLAEGRPTTFRLTE